VFLTGPRQSGKTTLARAAFPDFGYISLEDLQNRHEAVEDPRGFLRRQQDAPGLILDEVQRAPDLFSYIQGEVDEQRGGPYLLTGSQQFLLSEKIGQSLAGRAAILELLPLSIAELAGSVAREPDDLLDEAPRAKEPPTNLDHLLFSGLFPRIHDVKLDPATWLDGYVRTYVERDVRTVAGVGDLDSFIRFLGLCAGRAGGLVNSSSLGSDAGVSHVTAKRWLSILRASYVIDLLQPHHENFSKRLVKSPKLYFQDTGLLCHLLGIRRSEDLARHPLRGAIFENLVVSEFRKVFLHHGQRAPLFFWRDSHGHEVDLLVDLGARRVPVEIKSGATIASDFLAGLDWYGNLSGEAGGILVYGGEESYSRRSHLLRPWFDCS
jgi:predicted AAA+ superfamily ATPase